MSALDQTLRHIERYLDRRRPARRARHHVIPGGSIDKRPPLPEASPRPQRSLPPPPPAYLTVTTDDSLDGVAPLPGAGEICGACGQSHHKERRLAWLMRVEADKEDLIEAQPCWYGGGIRSAGERLLYRDLAELRSRRVS